MFVSAKWVGTHKMWIYCALLHKFGAFVLGFQARDNILPKLIFPLIFNETATEYCPFFKRFWVVRTVFLFLYYKKIYSTYKELFIIFTITNDTYCICPQTL